MAAIDPPATATAAPRPHGRFRALFDELWKDKPGFIGFSVIVLIILCAIFAPLIAPYDPAAQSVVARLKPPVWAAKGSWEHLLGTDQLGRDILSRLIYGARTSLIVGFSVVALAGAFGVTIGLVAGFRGGRTETILMRLVDIQVALDPRLRRG